MGHYMRYIVADERPVTLEDVRRALEVPDGSCEIEGDGTEATITHRGHRAGHLTINSPGDGIFDEERDELMEIVKRGPDRIRDDVLATLRAAQNIVAVQVLFGDGNIENTLAAIDPLWRWLHDNRRGLLQADGEGYYDARGLILKVR